MKTPRFQVPPIVKIVLNEGTKLCSEGLLGPGVFEAQLERLEKEELQPHGFMLLRRNLADGTIRFLIKAAKTGEVFDMIDCPGSAETPGPENIPGPNPFVREFRYN